MTITLSKESLTLEEFITNPTEGKEWIDGNLIEKTGMTIRHGKIQANLAYYIITQTQTLAFSSPDEVTTQKVLDGFCVLLNELFN